MKVQHVQALAAADPLPAAAGLQDGYTIIRDGKTLVVRSGTWTAATSGQSGGGSPVPPDPDNPDAPPPVGVPSEVEIAAYGQAFGTLTLPDTSSYVRNSGAVSTGFNLLADPGGVPHMVAKEDGTTLLMRRPGYYKFQMELVQGTIPASQRGHVMMFPWNGVTTALTLEPGQKAAYEGGVTYCANPDDDPDFGNLGGIVFTSLQEEIPANGPAPTPPFVVRFRVTPVIFTGPAVPMEPPATFEALQVQVQDSNHLQVTVDVSGADSSSVRAMVTKVEDENGTDVGFIGSWSPMTLSGGHFRATLEVPEGFTTNWAAYISVSASNGEYRSGASIRFWNVMPT